MPFIIRALIATALIASGACTQSPPPPASTASSSGDAALKQALSKYVVAFLRRNPTTSTYLGGAGLDASLRDVDGMLRDHSATALEQEDRWLEESARELEAIASATLSPNARIDREVALAQIRFMLRQHRVRRYQERAVDTYTSEPFRAIDWQTQGMTQTGPATYGTAEEWTLAIRRIDAVP